MSEERPVIVTDVDGVLLSWQSGLPFFAQKYNLPLEHILSMIQDDKFLSPGKLFDCDEALGARLIEKYNSSDFIRYLSAYMDALKMINTLKKRFDFVAITALGDTIDARLNRQFNLNALFPGAFQELLICDHNASKEELFLKARLKYGPRIQYYVDDLAKHVDAAQKILGCPVYWMPRGHRDEEPTVPHTKVEDWNNLVAIELKIEEAKRINKNPHELYWVNGFLRPKEDFMPKRWTASTPSKLKAFYNTGE